ncbi:MAG: hypothetical protein DMG06_19180 [Acidobacteria bacterium]|nr:MAG: hypothetical protein DMG06_19180 [Acidobacteriota bacterium]
MVDMDSKNSRPFAGRPFLATILSLTLVFTILPLQAQVQVRKTGRLPQSFPFALEETPQELTIKTSNYEVTLSREGFRLTVRREDKVILDSAQPGDAAANLGSLQQVTRLASFQRTRDGVVLNYETSLEGTSARAELVPATDSVRVTTWLLNNEANLVPNLRFRLKPSGFWYGGGFQGWRDPQTFPLNQAHIVKNQFLAEGNTQGTPCWYATGGVAIWVRTPGDFRYSINRQVNGQDDGLLSVEMPGVSSLAYDIIIGQDIRDLVQRVIRRLGYPHVVPPADYFRLPIYTTWVEYKTAVSQEKVLEFGHAIHDHDLPCGVIEIDDKWEEKYGDMKFDAKKFPDPKAMVDELHGMGYRVTLWAHPFVNVDTDTFAEHRSDGLLVRDRSGNTGLIKWWQGVAAVWDFTNPFAGAAFRSRLVYLQRAYGFDGFKFDGGDVNFTPRDLRAAQNITAAEYADIYNREATAHFAWNETRVGIYSQPLGIIQRLIDKHSVWGKENGLAAIVPEALTVSLRGFPYVMPDMVGGNQYDKDVIDRELFIRWAQASALMPLLQFSVGAWHFDDEVVRLSQEASRQHIKFAPYIFKLAQAASRTGEPILAPLWYHAPDEEETHALFDQFMLGPEVVVAPVQIKGANKRDVYLPAGRWRDDKTGEIVEGGRWLRNYPAPLDTLLVFVKEGSMPGAALPKGQ